MPDKIMLVVCYAGLHRVRQQSLPLPGPYALVPAARVSARTSVELSHA